MENLPDFVIEIFRFVLGLMLTVIIGYSLVYIGLNTLVWLYSIAVSSHPH